MKRYLILGIAAVGLALAAGAGPAAAAKFCLASSMADPDWEVPKTAWGDPDLRGTWPLEHLNGTRLERPDEYGDRRCMTDAEYAEKVKALEKQDARYEQELKKNQIGQGHWFESGEPQRITSLIVSPEDGKLPALTEWGEKQSGMMRSSWRDIVFDGREDFNALDRCITRGMPATMFPFPYNNGLEIWQTPDFVILRQEIVHETRVIPLGKGRPKVSDDVRQWLGVSRGHWEGNTLVVETTNFTGKTPMNIVGPGDKPIPTSQDMRIVERFTRVNADTIQYELTVEDPKTLKRPWTAAYPLKRDPGYEFFEYACHEGNRTIRDYISAFEAETAARETDN